MAPVLRAAATCALGLLLPIASALPASADVFFQAQTTATAVHVTITQQPAGSIITASLIDDAVAYAASDFDSSGGSDAQAAPAYPGRLVVQGPALLCSEVFPCPAPPPDYPLLAEASYPRNPTDKATLSQQPAGSGPFVVTPLTADAQAHDAGNAGDTAAGGASILAGTPVDVTVAASHSATSVHTTATTLSVHVESTVHDVDIGGLVHVNAVRAVDDITVADGKKPTDTPSITVSGVTVAGQPATIDDHGVHIAGQNGPSLSQRLDAQGISIRTVGVDKTDTATGGRSDAVGLAVDFAVPVSGVPYIPNPLPPLPPPFDQIPQLPGVNANGTYVGHVTLGSVGATGGVEQEPAFDLGGALQPTGTPGSVGGSSAAGGASAPLGGNQLVRSLGVPPVQAPPAVAAPRSGLIGFVDSLSEHALDILYAVLALGTAAMFIGWRGAVLLGQHPAALGRRR
jgi:hypothetical protein